ncbi:MAG: hypothetical protein JW822_04490 [Spirochaetales bacterium]|nr:hypothetical protein [Spirochaetales bacterium]
MKKLLVCTLSILVSVACFANGPENPLLGRWGLVPQFILKGGECDPAAGDGAIWKFIDDETIVVVSEDEDEGDIEMSYELNAEESFFTIEAGDEDIIMHYSVIDENTITLVVYLADIKQYNVAVLVSIGK